MGIKLSTMDDEHKAIFWIVAILFISGFLWYWHKQYSDAKFLKPLPEKSKRKRTKMIWFSLVSVILFIFTENNFACIDCRHLFFYAVLLFIPLLTAVFRIYFYDENIWANLNSRMHLIFIFILNLIILPFAVADHTNQIPTSPPYDCYTGNIYDIYISSSPGKSASTPKIFIKNKDKKVQIMKISVLTYFKSIAS
jgi:hypothetical protein